MAKKRMTLARQARILRKEFRKELKDHGASLDLLWRQHRGHVEIARSAIAKMDVELRSIRRELERALHPLERAEAVIEQIRSVEANARQAIALMIAHKDEMLSDSLADSAAAPDRRAADT